MRDDREGECIVVSVVSGGPDSFGYMLKWLSRGCRIHALTFHYGQKGVKEVDVARRLIAEADRIAREKGWGRIAEHRLIDISFMRELWSGTQLTDDSVEVKREYRPSVVVPIRNVVMSTIAAAYAYTLLEGSRGSGRVIVTLGSHADDVKPRPDTGEPLYPDCSPECMESLQTSLRICHFRDRRRLEVWSPSREGMRKSDIIREAYKLVGDLVYDTWSCYRSGEYHCGRCDSCISRHKAFMEAGLPDCTRYENPPGDPEEFTRKNGYYIHKSCRE